MRFRVAALLLPVALLAGCSASTPASGTLAGHLRQVGGLPPGVDRPVPGTVAITGVAVAMEIPVGQDGSYTVAVPPGTYTVIGHSPTVLNGNNQLDCPANGAVVVTSGTTTTADAFCSTK
jgi:hypothetical protein